MAGAVRRLTLPQWAAQPNLGNPLLHGQLRLLHTPFSTYVQGTPTKVNSPTITQDKLGQRTTFTAASSQYIDLGSPQSLTLGDELTFFAWYNLTSVPATGSSFTLIGKDHSSGGRSYTFDVLRNDVSPSQAGARLYVNGGAGGGIGIDVAYEGRQPVAGDDRLVVITRSVARNVSAIYVDGVVGAVTTASASTPTATSTARIGSRQYTSFEGYMNGSVRLAGIINAALTTDEVMELFRDPAGQLFIPARQRIWTAPVTAGGSVSLTVADATHGHTADGLVLTSSTALSVAEATHAHAADAIALVVGSVLTVAEASHAHAADSPTLTAASALAVADATHSHAADNITLSVAGATNLTVADALHSHAADALALTSAHALIVADATHGHAVDGLTLTAASVLAIQEALHAHAADNVTLDASGAVNLLLADGLHAHTADGVALTVAAWLTVADALHGHAADNVVLTFTAPDVDLDAPLFARTATAATRRVGAAAPSATARRLGSGTITGPAAH